MKLLKFFRGEDAKPLNQSSVENSASQKIASISELKAHRFRGVSF